MTRGGCRRSGWIALAALALTLAVAPGASAATTVGQTLSASAINEPCGQGYTFLQTTSPGNRYEVPADGVLKSWTFQTDDQPPELKLKVGRSVGGNDFTIVGESALETPGANERNTYKTNIKVRAGDVIGFYLATGGGCSAGLQSDYVEHILQEDVAPGSTETFEPFSLSQLSISAKFETLKCNAAKKKLKKAKKQVKQAKRKLADAKDSGDASAIATAETKLDKKQKKLKKAKRKKKRAC